MALLCNTSKDLKKEKSWKKNSALIFIASKITVEEKNEWTLQILTRSESTTEMLEKV